MTSSKRLALLLPPILCAAISPLSAQRPLNPTVTVLREASGPVPADCYDEHATPVPRVDVAELQRETAPAERPADRLPPPSADLRGRIRAAQSALASNDRASFRAALNDTRAMLTTYPPGAERDAAAEVVRVHDDIARIWDYQFDSPTGSFFDESSEPFTIANAYPGYRDAIRRQVIERGSTRLYPTSETRAFLGRIAAERASRLGVRAAAMPTTGSATRRPQIAEAGSSSPRNAGGSATPPSTRRSTDAGASTRSSSTGRVPADGRATTSSSRTTQSSSTSHASSAAATRRTSKPSARPRTAGASTSGTTAKTSRATTTPRTAVTASKNEAAATPLPPIVRKSTASAASTAQPSVATTSKPVSGTTTSPAIDSASSSAPPAVATTDTASTVSPLETTTTASSTSTESTATVDTAPTATDTTTPPAAPAETKIRGLLLPAVIVLVTIGVLIMLFRASD